MPLSEIDVIVLGKVIEVSEAQLSKALGPMLIKEFPIVREIRLIQPLYLEGEERQGIMRNNEENYCDLQVIVDFNTLVGGIWR